MPRALCSVSDKTGIVEFASALVNFGWELVASGGTQRALLDVGVPVTSVEQVTGQAEMLGGRVKTLHPAIHSGILARDTKDDLQELDAFGFAPISMVVCNLYPFVETICAEDVTLAGAVEKIDIGGVALLRAAAKNFSRVATVCDPQDYSRVIDTLEQSGQLADELRRELAVKAFADTRDYDTAIHAYLADSDIPALEGAEAPQGLSLSLLRSNDLRYGENPHQVAAFYSAKAYDLPLRAKQLGGKQLSYNNILDIDAAWRAVSSFEDPTVVIVKHLNPTGIATAETVTEAFPQALASDPLSAFGGIIAANREIDEDFVASLSALFVEVIIAPAFTEVARDQLVSRRKNCRILEVSEPYDGRALELRTVMGGMLLQGVDFGDPSSTVLRTVTKRVPLDSELESLRFAWKAVQHVKSNAIVLVQGKRTVGIGGGLPSRVNAVELAIKKAEEETTSAALASDAYFPFPDSIEVAARAGITCIVQPGGSIRDAQVIEAADYYDMAMIITGIRHFRH